MPIPNIMQCNCSMVITDPKAELLRKTGGVLERNGYEVRVFDLINPETSWCYNPFAYVRDDKDVLKLINNLIRNTTPKGCTKLGPVLGEVRDCTFTGTYAVFTA